MTLTDAVPLAGTVTVEALSENMPAGAPVLIATLSVMATCELPPFTVTSGSLDA